MHKGRFIMLISQDEIALYTKKLAVHCLKPGDVLAHDVYLQKGALVVKAGTELTDLQIDRLKKMGSSVVTLDLRKVYFKGILATKMLIKDASLGKPIEKKQVEAIMDPFIQEVNREKNVVNLLSRLQSKDEYTFQHSINIGVLAMVIGKWMGIEGSDLRKLTLAGTLHDIGKGRVPNYILNKPGPLDAKEFEIMKMHSSFGKEILEESCDYDDVIKTAVLQHHERENGSGYPNGLKRKDIHLFAKIIAIADVYHAMTTDRVYKKKTHPFAVLEHLRRNIDSLNSEIVFVFVEKMLNCLYGTRVLLSNGLTGKVVYIDKEYIAAPVIKLDEKNAFINLKTRNDIAITDIMLDKTANSA